MRGMPGYMRGVNLGGWLSQCSNPCKEHFDTFIVEDDIKRIADLDLDHVRVPVDYTLIETEDGQPINEGFVYIDNCIKWCQKYGLHMIIDLHRTYGYTFDPMDKADKTIFFKDAARQKRFFDLWARIASRYAEYNDTVAYELLNEIVLFEVKDLWNEIALKAIDVIRQYAPDSWIIFGGVFYNSVTAVKWLPVTSDRKVVYTFHCYEPMIFTHQGAYWVNKMPEDYRISYPKTVEEYREAASFLDKELAGAIYNDDIRPIGTEFFVGLFEPALAIAEERDIPLYCGEYGVIDRAEKEDTIRWLDDIHTVFEKYKIGRSLWNYKLMDFGISGDDVKPYLKEIAIRM